MRASLLLDLSCATSQRFGVVLVVLPRLFARTAVPSFRGRRWSGLGQTRASGGSRFDVLSVLWSYSWVPARDGTGVCSFPTWRCVRGLGWFCLWAFDLVESLRCAVGLAGAFWRVFPRAVPWWFWWRFSQDWLVLLLQFCLLRFFLGVLCVRFGPLLSCPCDSKCDVWLGHVLVRFSQDGSWRFLVEVLPKAALCCFGCRCSLSLYGDELSFLLGRCRSRCRALGCASGCCVGQLVLLVVSKFFGRAGGTCVSPWLEWFASFLAPAF
ncbi:hypothetical protein Taro_021601 [Colocasia esculenta]|uniref:Uncharacterized protein n=1 Tax=Colocasia esculenta TaxID=4460 RepID=A0A843VBZ6_COLES|nr:hypothetical protein [Colocasia esculenta]